MKTFRFARWCTLMLIATWGCETSLPANNPYDPDGSGPKAPGRIAGEIVVDGAADPSGFTVHVLDELNTEADTTTTDASGRFLTGELTPGRYDVEVDVPVENQAIGAFDVEVLPGTTTDIGRLVSPRAAAEGQLTGHVVLEDSTESPANVLVIASRDVPGGRETLVQYTDGDGNYLFGSVYPGTYRVRADRSGFTPDLATASVAGPARAPQVVRDLRLYPASAVVRFSVPTETGDVIGAPFTNTPDVDLILLAFGGVNQMRLSGSPDFVEGGADVAWRDHLAQVQFPLSGDEGVKTAYAQFRVVDNDDVEVLRTETYSTSVILDVTPPTTVTYVLAPEAIEANGQRYVTGDLGAVPVEVFAIDTFSGIDGVKLVVESANPATTPYAVINTDGPNLTYATTVSLSSSDGAKVVGLQLRDRAGNESGLLSRSVTVDTQGPAALATPAIVVSPTLGTSITSQSVALTFFVGADGDAGLDGPVGMRWGMGPLPSTESGPKLPFEPGVSVQLTAAHGETVQFWAVFYDAAGNDLRLETPVLTMNLLGGVRGRVYVEGTPDGAQNGHENTSVTLYGADDSDLSSALFGPVSTTGDGSYTFTDVDVGTYQALFSRSDFVSAVQAPVVVRAAQTTVLSLQRLQLARGNLAATFKYGGKTTGASHAGIRVEAWRGLTLEDTRYTDDAGVVVFSGLRVGAYELRASATGYLRKTAPVTQVIAETDTVISGELTLIELTGDFSICSSADAATPPGDCQALLYLNDDEVLLGLRQEQTLANKVRYVLSSGPQDESAFAFPDNTPSSDPGCTGTQCWQDYAPSTRYQLDVSGVEGTFMIVVQYALDDAKQQAGNAVAVRDTHAPYNPSVTILDGLQAVLPGLTRDDALMLELRAQEKGAGDPPDVSPLDVVQLSRTSSWVTVGGANGEAVVAYGPERHVFTVDGATSGSRDVYGWFCDLAGNCTTSVFDTIYLDIDPPTAATAAPVEDETVVDKTSQAGVWWARSTSYSVAMTLGDAGYALDLGGPSPYDVPDATAYQLSLSSTFVGAQWVSFDLESDDATSVVPVAGVGLPASEQQHTVHVRFRDAAGNLSTPQSFVLELDQTPPWGTVLIEAGAATTNKVTPNPLAVQLDTDDAVEIQTSWNGPLPSPGSSRTSYPAGGLLTGEMFGSGEPEGTKTLAVRFFDEAGNHTEASDAIILDRTGPKLEETLLTTLDGAQGATAAVDVLLQISASGADLMYLDGDLLSPTPRQWLPALPTVAVQLTSGGGPKSVSVALRDFAGNDSTPQSDSAGIYLDLMSPIVDPGVLGIDPVIINGGDSHTNDRTVLLELFSDDGPGSGVVDVAIGNAISIDCDTATYEPYAPTRVWTLGAADALDATVSVCFRDAVGNHAQAADDIVLDRTPPANLTLTLDGPATHTRDATVSATFSAQDNFTSAANLELRISDDPTLSGVAWGMTSPRDVTFTGGDGVQTVYLEARDEAGNVTSKSATIILDREGPTAPAISLTPSGYTASTTGISAQLSVSGATEMCLWGDFTAGSTDDCASYPGDWGPVASTFGLGTLTGGQGTNQVHASFRDAAGWQTSEVMASIILDSLSPDSGSVEINGTAPYATTRAVSLTLGATDTGGSGIVEMAVANGSIDCANADYEPFVSSKPWTLSPTEGSPQEVHVCFRDRAGNWRTEWDDITLDTLAPTAPMLRLGDGSGLTRVVQVDLTMTTAETGWTFVLWGDVDEAGTYTASAGDLPAQVNLNAPEGLNAVFGVLYDAAGNPSDLVSATIIFDETSPDPGSVTLNGGQLTLSSLTMSVLVEDTDPDTMMFWEAIPATAACGTPACSDPGFEAFSPASTFTLTSTSLGPKKVCWQFCDVAGNPSTGGFNDALVLGTYIARPTPVLSTITPTAHLALSNEGGGAPRYPITFSGRGIATDTYAEIGDFALPCVSTGGANCEPDDDGGCADPGSCTDCTCTTTCASSCIVDLPDSIMRRAGTYVLRLTTPDPVIGGINTSLDSHFFQVVAPLPTISRISPRGVVQQVDSASTPISQDVDIEVWGESFMDNVSFRLAGNFATLLDFQEGAPGTAERYAKIRVATAGLDPRHLIDYALVASNPSPGGGEWAQPFGLNPEAVSCPLSGDCSTNLRWTRAPLPTGDGVFQGYAFETALIGAVQIVGASAAAFARDDGTTIFRSRWETNGGLIALPFGWSGLTLEAGPERASAPRVTIRPVTRRNNGVFVDPGAGQILSTGSTPWSIVAEDFDGDGLVDLATANEATDDVSIFTNWGGGTFSPDVRLSAGDQPRYIDSADLDSDGRPDLVVTNTATRDVSIRLGTGGGTFGPRRNIPIDTGPEGLALADVNADGVVDLIAGCGGTCTGVAVRLGDGLGGFGDIATYDFGPTYSGRSIRVADINSDRIPDLAMLAGNSDIGILYGDGTGAFGNAQLLNVPDSSWLAELAVGDVDHDGTYDLVATRGDPSQSEISVFLGHGDGTFEPEAQFAGPGRTLGMAMADLTGDGNLDLAVSEFGTGVITIMVGAGDGTFVAGDTISTPGQHLDRIIVVDLDNNGTLDIATVAYLESEAYVARGTGTVVAPTPQTLETASEAREVALADLDRDGLADIVSNSNNEVWVNLNAGGGTFDPGNSYGTGYSIRGLITLDAQGDGLTDVALLSAWSSTERVELFPGNGDGTLGTRTTYAVNQTSSSVGPTALARGDVNADGRPDILVSLDGGQGVAVLLGRDHGDHWFGVLDGATYEPDTIVSIGRSAVNLQLEDVDLDGDLDIVTANSSLQTVSIRLNDGAGNFTDGSADLSIGSSATYVQVADVDSDGTPDIVLGTSLDQVYFALGTGGGLSYGVPSSLTLGESLNRILMADINGDQKPDLIGADRNRNQILVRLNAQGTNFGALATFDTGASPLGLATGLLNPDFATDLVAANNYGTSITVRPLAPLMEWGEELRNIADVSTSVAAGASQAFPLHHAAHFLTRAGVHVSVAGADLGNVSLSVTTPAGLTYGLYDGTGWAGETEWNRHYPAYAPIDSFTTMRGWHPEGDWLLTVDNSSGTQPVGLVDFSVSLHGRFKRAPRGIAAGRPTLVSPTSGSQGMFLRGTTLGFIDAVDAPCPVDTGSGPAESWFEIDLPAANQITARTDADFDTVVTIYEGACNNPSGTPVCDNDSGFGTNALVTSAALAAGPTCVVVDGVNGDGNFDLYLTFASAIP